MIYEQYLLIFLLHTYILRHGAQQISSHYDIIIREMHQSSKMITCKPRENREMENLKSASRFDGQ